jgi:hypothetical protein
MIPRMTILGITTLSTSNTIIILCKVALSIVGFCAEYQYAGSHFAECHIFISMILFEELNVTMLDIIMLSFIVVSFMLSSIILDKIMLSFIIPSIKTLSIMIREAECGFAEYH